MWSIRKTDSGWRIGSPGLDGHHAFYNAWGDTVWALLWDFVKLRWWMRDGTGGPRG